MAENTATNIRSSTFVIFPGTIKTSRFLCKENFFVAKSRPYFLFQDIEEVCTRFFSICFFFQDTKINLLNTNVHQFAYGTVYKQIFILFFILLKKISFSLLLTLLLIIQMCNIL